MRYGRYQLAGLGPGGGGPEPGPNEDTSFDIEFTAAEIGSSHCQLQLYVRHLADSGNVTVDWGDGMVQTCADGLATHDYTAAGLCPVRIGREAAWFRVWDCYTVDGRRLRTARPRIRLNWWGDRLTSANGTFCGWSNSTHGGLVGTLPRWGRSIESTSCCFEYCTDLEGTFPEWTDAITDASGTYQHVRFAQRIPEWGRNITNCASCFYECPNVYGPVPPWPEGCVDTNACYYGCANLEGEIPPWPAAAQVICTTYMNCPGLVGTIPPWPEGIRDVSCCYWNCTGLTGAWTDDPALLMPEEKVRYAPDSDYYCCRDTVTGCSDAVRALFWTNWGGTLPHPA